MARFEPPPQGVRREVNPLTTPRTVIGRMLLVPLWIGFAFWLVLADRPAPNPSDVTPDGKKFIASMFAAVVVVMVGGLFKPWRWPIKLSRVMAVFLLGPMIVIGPAGRSTAVYLGDVAFAVAIAIVSFLVVRSGPIPPPRDWPRWATPRRWKRAQEHARNQRKY